MLIFYFKNSDPFLLMLLAGIYRRQRDSRENTREWRL